MNGCSRWVRFIGEADEDIVEVRNITDGDGLAEDPIAQVFDELVLLWEKTHQGHVGADRYHITDVNNLRRTVGEHRRAGAGDEVG